MSLHLALEVLEDRRLLRAVVPVAMPVNLTVMSQNLYLGAELGPVISAAVTGRPDQIAAAVTQLWQSVQATNFPERAQAIAREIQAKHPDLIGLQEVELFRTGAADSLWGNATRAGHVELDYLNTLLAALGRLGLRYKAVAVTTESDTELPGYTAPGVLRDIRLTDRDVILARNDSAAAAMTFSNIQQQHFAHNIKLPIGLSGQAITVYRGWNSVDVQWGGKQFRFVNTHLETKDNALAQAVQVAQAMELVSGPLRTTKPLIVVGDFNAPADTNSTTYRIVAAACLNDAWKATHASDPGYTYGNAADLRNATPLAIDPQRIDLVLARGWMPQGMDRIGDQPSDRTPSGLWPSDHAGVVATLVL